MPFEQHPQAWTRVDQILERSQCNPTKMLALNVLTEMVKKRWNLVPQQPREMIRKYIVTHIIRMSQNPETLRQRESALLLKRMNLTLVEVRSGMTVVVSLTRSLIQILKKEWPHNWPNFVPELIDSSKSSQSLCTNNMNILSLLIEDIFTFGDDEFVADRVQQLKSQFSQHFLPIFHLCDFIFTNSTDGILVKATLQCVQKMVHLLPVNVVFESSLLQLLTTKFLPVEQFKFETLQVLTEIFQIPLKDGACGPSPFVLTSLTLCDHQTPFVTIPSRSLRLAPHLQMSTQ